MESKKISISNEIRRHTLKVRSPCCTQKAKFTTEYNVWYCLHCNRTTDLLLRGVELRGSFIVTNYQELQDWEFDFDKHETVDIPRLDDYVSFDYDIVLYDPNISTKVDHWRKKHMGFKVEEPKPLPDDEIWKRPTAKSPITK